MKKLIKKTFEYLGYKITRTSHAYYEDAFHMQKQLVENSSADITIFDIGAYVGQIALRYNLMFPNSKIYCFEPYEKSFRRLQQNVKSNKNIVAINKGVGEISGKIEFHSNYSASTNSVLATHKDSEKVWGSGLLNTFDKVDIELTTLDDFIETYKIPQIDILKLDVQGSEYMVINGAKNALKQNKIRMIYTEIITMPTYEGQKYLDEILGQLRLYGFQLFNFYNSSLTNSGQLRQVDGIFIQQNSTN